MASGSPQLQETLSEQQDDVPFPGLLLQEQAYGTTPNPYRGWTAGSTVSPGQARYLEGRDSVSEPLSSPDAANSGGLRESDPEDFLQLIINPDHLYSTGSRLGSPESDSGISEEPRAAESPPSSQASGTPPPPVYEVVCDPSSGTSHILSIQLGDWTPPMLIPDACIVSELLPGPSALAVGNLGAMPDAPSCCPSLLLTEEERQLLSQEGISLPSNLP
uniref:Uncharacterized protein n=1 Tax=Sphenodon punctatus TaxID=8508 RepID=A0A8D0GCD3_SPHPU